MNWSRRTMSPGWIFSCSEPHAVVTITCVQPSALSAWMLARKLMVDGSCTLCCLPCLKFYREKKIPTKQMYQFIYSWCIQITWTVRCCDINTYHAGHWFYWAKLCLFSQNSNISEVISGITKPILGMLVLIWMHFLWRFQICSWNYTILTFFTKLVTFLTCRLHSPAAWKALTFVQHVDVGAVKVYTMCCYLCHKFYTEKKYIKYFIMVSQNNMKIRCCDDHDCAAERMDVGVKVDVGRVRARCVVIRAAYTTSRSLDYADHWT